MLVKNWIDSKFIFIADADFNEYKPKFIDVDGNVVSETGEHIKCESISIYYAKSESLGLDYKQMRREVRRILELKGVVFTTDISGKIVVENIQESILDKNIDLYDEDIYICSKLFILRDSYSTLTEDEKQDSSKEFSVKSTICRNKRMNIAFMTLFNSILQDNIGEVISSIPEDYRNAFVSMQQAHILNYIDTTLRGFTYISDVLADKLIDILENGV